jgi:hypothetical protein
VQTASPILNLFLSSYGYANTRPQSAIGNPFSSGPKIKPKVSDIICPHGYNLSVAKLTVSSPFSITTFPYGIPLIFFFYLYSA